MPVKKFLGMVWLLALAFVVLFSAVSSERLESYLGGEKKYEEYISRFSKTYSGEERTKRFEIFQANLKMILEHNQNKGFHGFSLGLGPFTDLTNEEYREQFLGANEFVTKKSSSLLKKPRLGDLPPSNYDLRTLHGAAPIMQISNCGNGYHFAAKTVLEYCDAIKNNINPPLNLGIQKIIDCGDGCTNSDSDDALTYIKNNGGLPTEANYPYTGVEAQCSSPAPGTIVTVGYYSALDSDEDDIKKFLYNKGAVAVNIDASPYDFQHYTWVADAENIYNSDDCSTYCLNYWATLVGYGKTETNHLYWILKATYGTFWGNDGYMRLERGTNRCGVEYFPIGLYHTSCNRA